MPIELVLLFNTLFPIYLFIKVQVKCYITCISVPRTLHLNHFLMYEHLLHVTYCLKAHYLFTIQPSTSINPSESVVATISGEPVDRKTNFEANCHNILSLGTKRNDHLHDFGDKLSSNTVTSGREKIQGEHYIQEFIIINSLTIIETFY